jgi:TetR/AcrR family transcriptional regulator, mexJK operon transcriptional repressor
MSVPKSRTAASGRATPQRGRPPLDRDERKRILDATAKVFLERGFRRASTSEIARRAHTSKQTLYALFPTKADLFVGVIGAHTEHLFARHAYFIESGKSPRQTLTEMGHLTLKMFSAPEFLALYRIVVAEAHEFPDLARQLWQQCLGRGYGLLAEYLQSRRIGGPRYAKSAAQFVSFVLGDFILNAVLNPDCCTSERALHAGVKKAVEDFLRLHPVRKSGK